MQLGFSTNAFTRFPLTEALRAIASCGFAGVEILADAPHVYPDAIDDALTREVRKTLEANKLAVSNINANCTFGYWKHAPPEPFFEPSIISPDPKLRADRTRMIFKTLDFAKGIGASNISITSGKLLPGMPPDQGAKQFAESIRPILDYADKQGVNIGIECEPGLYVEYIDELCAWIRQLNHPRLGANLDIGHSVVIGEDIRTVVHQLGARIWNMHVEDLLGRKHYHLIPGEGNLAWTRLRDALREIGYKRFLTCELYTYPDRPHEAAEKSYAFLQRLIG